MGRIPYRQYLHLTMSLVVLVGLVGCMPESQVYDKHALVTAKRIAVMPVVRPEGLADGSGQAGVLLTELSSMDYYDVEGVGRFRRALRQVDGREQNDLALQTKLAQELGIDVLGVCEVTDYRWTTKNRGAYYLVGTANWTECTYHVALHIRLISPEGKVLYTGKGQASSKKGYGPATLEATTKALTLLRNVIQRAKRNKEARGA